MVIQRSTLFQLNLCEIWELAIAEIHAHKISPRRCLLQLYLRAYRILNHILYSSFSSTQYLVPAALPSFYPIFKKGLSMLHPWRFVPA